MLYILDANVLMDAHRDYYSIERVPEFWNWLLHHGERQTVKIPVEVCEEIRDGNDDLAEWARSEAFREHLPAFQGVRLDPGNLARNVDGL